MSKSKPTWKGKLTSRGQTVPEMWEIVVNGEEITVHGYVGHGDALYVSCRKLKMHGTEFPVGRSTNEAELRGALRAALCTVAAEGARQEREAAVFTAHVSAAMGAKIEKP